MQPLHTWADLKMKKGSSGMISFSIFNNHKKTSIVVEKSMPKIDGGANFHFHMFEKLKYVIYFLFFFLGK